MGQAQTYALALDLGCDHFDYLKHAWPPLTAAEQSFNAISVGF